MHNRKKLDQLNTLSKLILDQRLAKLQARAAERNASLQRLQNLTYAAVEQSDQIELARAVLRYERWADERRSDINIALASQTAHWMEARQAAVIAFGRAHVLKCILRKI